MTPQPRILVVEDETDLVNLIQLRLEREGFRVSAHTDGEAGWAAIQKERPDLVLLDVMLPGLDGLEICRRIRRSEQLAGTPVLMLTARGEEADEVAGLEVGSDDYVTKPFSPRVLVARVRALLRRGKEVAADRELTRLGPISIDSGRHEVRIGGERLDVTNTEFRILSYLAKRPGRVRTRADILLAIGEAHVLERTVDVHVASLRRKLGEAGTRIETVRGVGYRASETP